MAETRDSDWEPDADDKWHHGDVDAWTSDQARLSHIFGEDSTPNHQYRPRSQYVNTTVSGQSWLHQGDYFVSNNNYWYTTREDPNVQATYEEKEHADKARKRALLIDSLKYGGMGTRLNTIATAMSNTCQWLFEHNDFYTWTRQDVSTDSQRFFWVKGNPGTGKSTLLKVLLGWAKTNWPDEINLFYLFNGRSTGTLEKSSIGMYRSMVHQLLAAEPSTRPLFFTSFEAKISSVMTSGIASETVNDWEVVELQEFLLKVIAINDIRPVNIFIDALDEGDIQECRLLVSFLRKLDLKALACGTRLRICLSSRHYPHITIKREISLTLEDEPDHNQDIATYLNAELELSNMRGADIVRKEISRKASGIFLWVVIVVPIVNQIHDIGGNIGEMLEALNHLPSQLYDLFAMILGRNGEERQHSIVLLQWILYALDPLSVAEISAVLSVSDESQALETIYEQDNDRTQRRITHYSCGLVEIKHLSDTQDFIQFIHQSVPDFLKSYGELDGQTQGFSGDALGENIFDVSKSQAAIAGACLHYLDIAGKTIRAETRNPPLCFSDFPLSRYAANRWAQHARNSGPLREQKLLQFAMAILGDQDGAALLLELYFPDRDHHYWMHEKVSPLVIAAAIGHPSLVKCILRVWSHQALKRHLWEDAVNIAENRKHHEVVEILHDADPDNFIASSRRTLLAKGEDQEYKVHRRSRSNPVPYNEDEEEEDEKYWDIAEQLVAGSFKANAMNARRLEQTSESADMKNAEDIDESTDFLDMDYFDISTTF